MQNYIRTVFNISDLIKKIELKENNLDQDEEYEEEDSLWWWIANSMSKSMVMESSMDSDDMAMDESEWISSPWSSNWSKWATKLRTDFKDIAYYKWIVNIVNWKAIINVNKLPDNLTTWVIKWYTITSDTKIWNFESKFKVRKTLNLLPSIPRFFVSWDELEVSAIVVNNSNNK